MLKKETEKQLRLDDPEEIGYWASRWGVTPRQLKNAIIDTGSLDLAGLREHLRRSGSLPVLPQWMRSLTLKTKRVTKKIL